MDDGFQFLDIILIAIIAAFLIFRLRGVLGRRDGHQGDGRPGLFPTSDPDRKSDKVVQLPTKRDGDSESASPWGGSESPSPLEAGLTQIRIAEPNFDPDEFVSGARMAFELVVSSYASGDASALRPLLSPEVFTNFSHAMMERDQRGETMEAQVVAIKSAEIDEAYMAGRTAHLSVTFVSDQISVIRNEQGEIIEGDTELVNEVTDHWTFARDTRSADPNWTLVATDTPD